jgi:hypothetical protein
MIVARRKYRLSTATESYERILIPLVRSSQRYCLLLRRFGRDAQTILPKANGKGRVGGGTVFTKNTTMEQVVGAAASAAGMETFGIVDQNTRYAPPGVTFMRASNDEWQMVAQRLIKRAHSIVLAFAPGQVIGEGGDGFAWEIEQIVACGAQSRVIIVLPPYDQNPRAHAGTVHQACIVLALLSGSGRLADLDDFKVREYELILPDATQVVRYKDNAGPSTWGLTENAPQGKKKAVVADSTYLPCITAAFHEIEHDLAR